jgi:hypothetical protein
VDDLEGGFLADVFKSFVAVGGLAEHINELHTFFGVVEIEDTIGDDVHYDKFYAF